MGRPSTFNQETADEICSRIVDGRSLRSIAADEDMPSVATIIKWLRDFPRFTAQYARAKEEQADVLAEEILDISDDGRNDWMERLIGEDIPVGWTLNGEHIQRSKLRVDSRKWIAAKLKPKKYGDFQRHEVDASVTTFEGADLSVLSADELETLTAIARKLAESKHGDSDDSGID